jgi:glycosyltransferase involved in cell wall biosynthesis
VYEHLGGDTVKVSTESNRESEAGPFYDSQSSERTAIITRLLAVHIALIIRGLFEKSDSVGYDCVFQYCCMSKNAAESLGASTVDIYAEKFDPDVYPEIPIKPISEFYKLLNRHEKDLTIIYHYCDGWPDIDNLLMRSLRHNIVVRWHNNTPPWFYVKDEPQFAQNTLRGYEQMVSFLKSDAFSFWVNSEFSKRQLEALGANEDRISVVFPASRYLEKATLEKNEISVDSASPRPLRLLFVSRMVAHKGHRHVIAVAGLVRGLLNLPVHVHFVGRMHPSSTRYYNQLNSMATENGVKLFLHGEVTEEELLSAYRTADVFICLSEHEGFGLPIFEAIRCGVPVVAWANTASAELLQDHPLASKKFSPKVFAEHIVSLQNSKHRSDIIRRQFSMLSIYTFDVVRNQIEQGLRRSRPPAQLKTAHPVTSLQNGSAPFDSIENLVSLYDIQNYRYFLSHILGMEPELTWLSRMTVGPAGERQGDFIRVKRGRAADIAFGPYLSLPTGTYRLHVELKARSGLGERLRVLRSWRKTEITCEIISGSFVLARQSYNGLDILRGPKCIDFRIDDLEGDGKMDAIEFRLWTRGKLGVKLKSINLERDVLATEVPQAVIFNHPVNGHAAQSSERAPRDYYDNIAVEVKGSPDENVTSITTH